MFGVAESVAVNVKGMWHGKEMIAVTYAPDIHLLCGIEGILVSFVAVEI